MAVFLIGFVIKWLDDEVDFKEEAIISKNSTIKAQEYKLPYCLLFLSLAMLLDTYYSFALFTSAYIIGMFDIPFQKLPFGLKSYQEIIFILIINIMFVPIKTFIHSLTLILIIQLVDDLIDFYYDKRYGFKNFAVKFGRGEVLIATFILAVMSLMLSLVNTIIVLPVAFFINYLYLRG